MPRPRRRGATESLQNGSVRLQKACLQPSLPVDDTQVWDSKDLLEKAVLGVAGGMPQGKLGAFKPLKCDTIVDLRLAQVIFTSQG